MALIYDYEAAGILLKKGLPLVGMSYCLTQEMGLCVETFYLPMRTEKSAKLKKQRNHMRQGEVDDEDTLMAWDPNRPFSIIRETKDKDNLSLWRWFF